MADVDDDEQDDYPTYAEVVTSALAHGDAWAPAEAARIGLCT